MRQSVLDRRTDEEIAQDLTEVMDVLEEMRTLLENIVVELMGTST